MKRIVKTGAISAATICAAATCVALGWTIRSAETFTQNTALSVARSNASLTQTCAQSSDVLATLNSITEPVRRATQAPDLYWQPALGRTHDSVAALFSAQANARESLVRAFGDDARQMATTLEIFRPLDRRLPFLNNEEQLKVALLESEYIFTSPDSDKPADYRRFELALARAIGAEMAFEYALREAPLAHELRASGVIFDEQDFRDAFQILNRFNAGGISATEYLALRTDLLNALGSQRALHIWSQRDPRFRQLESVAEHYNFSRERLMSAYALLSEQQDALLAAASAQQLQTKPEAFTDSNAANSTEHAAELGTIFTHYRTRLAELIGDAEAAETLQQIFLSRPESAIKEL